MARFRTALVTVGLISLSVIGCAAGTRSSSSEAIPMGWIDLFNGKDMEGWRMTGKGDFIVEDGALVTRGGMGLLYYEKQKFRDFVLEVEWKVAHQCNNSGIFVRFPEKTDDPWYAVNNGYEIQIDDEGAPDGNMVHKTGAIYGMQSPPRIASVVIRTWYSSPVFKPF